MGGGREGKHAERNDATRARAKRRTYIKNTSVNADQSSFKPRCKGFSISGCLAGIFKCNRIRDFHIDYSYSVRFM